MPKTWEGSICDLLGRAVHQEQGDERAPGTVIVQGWVRTSRFGKNVTFIHLFDGSTEKTIQVVVSPPVSSEMRARLGTGTALRVKGALVPSPGPKQPSEIQCPPDMIEILGECDPSVYPVQKKEASNEFWRTIPHLRMRTAEFQRIFRARNAVSAAIHQFFQSRGFMWIHTPIITASDCEGAGEAFHVAIEQKTRVTLPGTDVRTGETRWWLDGESFFGRSAFLTVSGQLEVEPFACAFTKVYTFGPTFRAENSNTGRHASEFWMIEPEIAFTTKDDVMNLAEDMIRFVAKAVDHDKFGLDAFARVTYTEAQSLLEKSGRTFEHPIGWGQPLQTEHERFLAEEHFKSPVFVTDYPATLKPFYMRISNDGRTVECFDLLVPGVGEIIGGSAREERLDRLVARMEECNLNPADYDWYLDLRRFGTVQHGGFGLGLERLLMWLLDVPNIRDVLPYPRTPGQI